MSVYTTENKIFIQYVPENPLLLEKLQSKHFTSVLDCKKYLNKCKKNKEIEMFSCRKVQCCFITANGVPCKKSVYDCEDKCTSHIHMSGPIVKQPNRNPKCSHITDKNVPCKMYCVKGVNVCRFHIRQYNVTDCRKCMVEGCEKDICINGSRYCNDHICDCEGFNVFGVEALLTWYLKLFSTTTYDIRSYRKVTYPLTYLEFITAYKHFSLTVPSKALDYFSILKHIAYDREQIGRIFRDIDMVYDNNEDYNIFELSMFRIESKFLNDIWIRYPSTILAHTTDDNCGICLSNFELNTKVCKLPCKHMYHAECFNEWYAINNSCPLDRCKC